MTGAGLAALALIVVGFTGAAVDAGFMGADDGLAAADAVDAVVAGLAGATGYFVVDAATTGAVVLAAVVGGPTGYL